MADYALNDDNAHLYGPVLGMPALRQALADQIATHYGGEVADAQVAITSGCNEAFAAAITALTGEGDEVILPTPWYFNHKMWLDMTGVKAVPLPAGDGLLPDPDRAAGRAAEHLFCDRPLPVTESEDRPGAFGSGKRRVEVQRSPGPVLDRENHASARSGAFRRRRGWPGCCP